MVGGKSCARSLGLVAIVVVLLLGRVAGAGNSCYGDCCGGCARDCFLYSPPCLANCALTCAVQCVIRAGNIEERKQADAVHYCKLGCASSVCSAIATTLRLYSSAGRVGEEAVKGSVKRCDDACSEICTKRFGTTVIAA